MYISKIGKNDSQVTSHKFFGSLSWQCEVGKNWIVIDEQIHIIQSERHFIWVTQVILGTQRFNPDLWKIALRALLVSRSQRHTRYPHVIIMDCPFIFLNNQLLLHNFERSIALHFSNKMIDYFKIGLLNKPFHISAVVRLESPILDWTSRSSQEELPRPSRFRNVVWWHYITDKKSTWTR